LLILVLAGGLAFAAGSAAPSSDAAKPIKIGMIFPFSGPNADQGIFNRNGANMAVEKINAAGGIKSLGGRKLEVVFYDNQSSSDMSRVVAERLLAEHPDLVAVSGAAASAFVLPMLASFEKAQVPFLTAQASPAITGQGYQFAFTFSCQSPQLAGTQVAMLEWLNQTYKVGITKIGLVYEDTEWGLTNSQAAREEIKKSSNLTLVYDQTYQPAASDLSSIVVGLMNAGCEVVFPTSYTQDAKLLFNTMVQYRYSPLVVGGGGGFLYPVFAQDLGDLVDGVLSVASHNYDTKSVRQNPLFANIGEEYEARFKDLMPEQGVGTFSAVYIISQALEKAGSTDRIKLRDTIRSLTITTPTPGGALNFNAGGWNQNGACIMAQWQKDKDGVFRPHAVFPPSEATVEFQLTDMLKARVK